MPLVNVEWVFRFVSDEGGKSREKRVASPLSLSPLSLSAIFNLLKRTDILLVAEGLDVFKVRVPEALAGKTLTESNVRQKTGCSVIAVDNGAGAEANPAPDTRLSPNAEIIVIGSAEAEERFLARYGNR